MAIDLNCDAGEAFGAWRMGEDEALIPLMTSVNIACGAHAGDPLVMRRTIALAQRYGVAIGAHPSYPDLLGFGRRVLPMPPDEVSAWLLAQIGALAGVARGMGARLHHVKPHGALYNVAADDPALASAIAEAVYTYDPALILVARAGSPQVAISRTHGLLVAEEAFIDRGYDAQGKLLPRGTSGALIHDATLAATRGVALARHEAIMADDGTPLALHADTLCIHSDTAGAPALATALRAALDAAGVEVRTLEMPPGT
jgi:UPF0271 protein